MILITWNVQWCRGVDGRVDPERIVSAAKELADFDVLCLQEIADNFPDPRLAGNTDEDQFAALATLLPGFTAIDGASCMVMTSGAWRIGIFSPDAPMRSSSARTRGSSPTTITSIPLSRTAETIPSTSTRGAPSAPIASMAIGGKARAAPLPSAR